MGVGRPAFFNSPDELKDKVEQYYEECKLSKENLTITGLALYLGFESRQSFYDYEKHEEYSYIIKVARLKVENDYEKRLSQASVTGAIFALKNMGWTDKQEIDQRSTIKDERIDLTKLTDEELRFLAKIQSKGGVSEA